MLDKSTHRTISDGTIIVLAILTLFLALICANYIRHQTLENPNLQLETAQWSTSEHNTR